jgi:hypothetical protein
MRFTLLPGLLLWRIYPFLAFFLVSWGGVRLSPLGGRATAQAVSRWLPTAAARVQTRVWSRGIL